MNCPIFISSSDTYSDIWPVFFGLFKKYWSDFDGQIYLNTEKKSYHFQDLKIQCTKIGTQPSFGKAFRMGLDKVDSDEVLLIMIDYIILDKVNTKLLNDYYQYYKNNNLDSLCLINQNYPNCTQTEHSGIIRVIPPAKNLMFSYQTAFWKKSVLKEMALPHENPWSSEWFGSRRANKMRINLATVSSVEDMPIKYHPAGCIHRGKWHPDAVKFLKKTSLLIDFDQRGIFNESLVTVKRKLKFKINKIKHGLRGSYIDLLFRKPI